MKRNRQLMLLAASGLGGAALGAGCVWFALHPITRATAAWLRFGGDPATRIEVMHPGQDGVVREYPIIRLAKSPNGTDWTLVVMGKAKATSKHQILPLLSKLAQYESGLVIVIQPETGLDVESLHAAIKEITAQGLHRFYIQDMLWGTTETTKDGFVY
jgi:hypothetical protein